jgi:hypothetical protein
MIYCEGGWLSRDLGLSTIVGTSLASISISDACSHDVVAATGLVGGGLIPAPRHSVLCTGPRYGMFVRETYNCLGAVLGHLLMAPMLCSLGAYQHVVGVKAFHLPADRSGSILICSVCRSSQLEFQDACAVQGLVQCCRRHPSRNCSERCGVERQ